MFRSRKILNDHTGMESFPVGYVRKSRGLLRRINRSILPDCELCLPLCNTDKLESLLLINKRKDSWWHFCCQNSFKIIVGCISFIKYHFPFDRYIAICSKSVLFISIYRSYCRAVTPSVKPKTFWCRRMNKVTSAKNVCRLKPVTKSIVLEYSAF